MTRKRREQPHGGPDQSANTPIGEDEGDILEEAGVERDEETGELVATEDRVRELGAIDTESVQANRRTQAMVNKKRANVKNVTFNTGDLLSKYDAVIQVWPAATLDITVRRLTGTPVQHVIISRPKSGVELYEALKTVHGAYAEAEYDVRFQDFSTKQWCGIGKITMPNTLPQQGQQPMAAYYPPGYPPPGYPPGYPPPVQQQPSPQPQAAPAGVPPTPVIFHAPPGPAGPDMATMMASVKQMFEMFQAMQPQAAPQQHSAMLPPPPPQFVMPPPPANPDMASMMTYMQQMFEMFRTMQPGATPQPPPPVYTQTPHAPPAGSEIATTMALVKQVFEMVQAMQPPQPPAPAPRSSYRDRVEGRSYERGDREYGEGRSYERGDPESFRRYPAQPPPKEQTVAEQLKDALGLIRTITETSREIGNMSPNTHHVEEEAPPSRDDDDDSPIKIIDTGQGKIAVNKSNGQMRLWETGLANLDKILKFTGEQADLIRKAGNERQQKAQEPQLPPGYVEVRQGYKPPPGFVAVAVEPDQVPYAAPPQTPLPPPPEDLPPPIQRTWGASTISEREES